MWVIVLFTSDITVIVTSAFKRIVLLDSYYLRQVRLTALCIDVFRHFDYAFICVFDAVNDGDNDNDHDDDDDGDDNKSIIFHCINEIFWSRGYVA